MFLMLGDTTYNDGATSVADYRAKWDESLASAGWRAVRQATSVLATWDDHEVDNNFDPSPTTRRTRARRSSKPAAPARRDRSGPHLEADALGLTAGIFVLDCRGERLPSTRGDTDVYLSRAQMDWLKAGLRDSPCVFKLIMNSVPISDFPFPSEPDRWRAT
ncbi:MAG: alkaline phosphatase D family protein [Sandaracinaceae bacterium]|nr:alkaline phosphatase D family protein [Sandaracinaceae bacterium]